MSNGFFSAADARRVKPLPTLHPRCDQCGLFQSCHSPRMRVAGSGRRRILVVGEQPGAAEDRQGQPLVGQSGQYLSDVASSVGLSLRDDCWLTNALICHDTNKSEPKTAVDDCRPNLLNTIRQLKPTTIILAGQMAVTSLIGHLWKPDVGPIGRWTGRQIPSQKLNAWLCPVHNPAYLLRDKVDRITKDQFREALREAASLTTVPYPDGPPDYSAMVERIYSPNEAAARIRNYTSGRVAFDFETTCLKPEAPGAEIVCCSVCWEGRETISFPWHGQVIPAVRELITRPDVGLIASNLKMEDRWCRRHLGTEPRHWAWDTMLAAHCLDPRPGGTGRADQTPRGSGTTGLKFLSFVHLGVPDYNSHVEDGLSADGGGNALNRIKQLSIDTLLTYCGLDSLLEYEVAKIQARMMGTAWD